MSIASGCSACAADTHLAVAGVELAVEVFGDDQNLASPSQQPLLLQRRDQFRRVLDHHALAAFRRRRVVRGLERVAGFDAEVGERDRLAAACSWPS